MSVDALLALLETPNGSRDRPAAWSLFHGATRGVSLGVKDRLVGGVHSPISLARGSGARYLFVWDDGRVSRGQLERRQLDGDPAEVLAWARASAYDDPDAATIAEPAELPDVALHDPEVAAIADGDVAELGRRLAICREHVTREGHRTWSGSLSAVAKEGRLRTSTGVDYRSAGTQAGWYVYVNGEYGDGFGARTLDPEASLAARLARLSRLVHALDGDDDDVAGGERPVLLHPHVVRAYVLETLSANLRGAAVAHGESHFAADAFDGRTPSLREDLFLRVDPLRPLHAGAYRFTVEGVPARRVAFVAAGCLVRPILDLKYARRLGRPPTPQILDEDCVEFGDGRELDERAALDELDGSPLVLSVLGVHTQDSGSGDFSLAAPQALVVRSGRFTGRTRGTLSGNLFEILRDPRTRFVRFEGETLPGMRVVCRFDPGDRGSDRRS